jgi:hypothetical protein
MENQFESKMVMQHIHRIGFSSPGIQPDPDLSRHAAPDAI